MRGIEPRLRAPEARVLPLYDIPLGALQAHPVFDSVTAESSVGPVVGVTSLKLQCVGGSPTQATVVEHWRHDHGCCWKAPLGCSSHQR